MVDLHETLVESRKQKRKSGWRNLAGSFALHAALLGVAIYISASATHQVAAEDKTTPVFISSSPAPPPPPPPPPPPAPAAHSAPQTPKQLPEVEPVVQQHDSFVQPEEVPDQVPEARTTSQLPTSGEPLHDLSASAGGVEGGVEGGVVGGEVGGETGGVLGGEVGGEIGGVVGGVIGGEIGGEVGGEVGGTGGGSGVPSGPLRVGGNVKAPKLVEKVEPVYNELARKAKVDGVVILEAIINRNGNVENVKVIRGLPMGLSDSAVAAVKRWKFKPGTMNGRPVDVIFNLTVNFSLG